MSLFKLKKHIGSRLRDLRQGNDMAVKDLSLKLKVEPITIYKYESGEHLPSIEVLIRYVRLFNVSSDFILGCNENTNRRGRSSNRIHASGGSSKARQT